MLGAAQVPLPVARLYGTALGQPAGPTGKVGMRGNPVLRWGAPVTTPGRSPFKELARCKSSGAHIFLISSVTVCSQALSSDVVGKPRLKPRGRYVLIGPTDTALPTCSHFP